MPAHSENFPWPNYYGHFRFFEDRMRSHSDILSLEHQGGGLYEIIRNNGKIIRTFICECYAFGVAEYFESTKNLGHLDAIIIDSAWCGYTSDVKRHCRDLKVGIFKIGDFMRALKKNDFWKYLNEQEIEYFRENGWI